MPTLQLHLADGAFRLPLKPKAYVMGSSEVRRYLAWAKETTVQAVEEDHDSVADLELAVNQVGMEEASYVGADLVDVLWRSELGGGGVESDPSAAPPGGEKARRRAGRHLSQFLGN